MAFEEVRSHQEVYADKLHTMASVLHARANGENDRLMGPDYIDEISPRVQETFYEAARMQLQSLGIEDPTLRVLPGGASDNGESIIGQRVIAS